MNRYDLISFLALLMLVIALPVYAVFENNRMSQAQTRRQQELLVGAGDIYLGMCSVCHGLAGEGIGNAPPLNSDRVVQAGREFLVQAIAGNAASKTMVAWHLENGGPLNRYQIEQLATLIQNGNWENVKLQAQTKGLAGLAIQPVPSIEMVTVTKLEQPKPHECRACHEDPALHAGQFGTDCARCHSLEAWTPAYLTRHIFPLDHGAPEQLACQTCHLQAYTAYTCNQCHDHQLAEIETSHTAYGIVDVSNCAACHPTGRPGEADRLRQERESTPDAGKYTARLLPTLEP